MVNNIVKVKSSTQKWLNMVITTHLFYIFYLFIYLYLYNWIEELPLRELNSYSKGSNRVGPLRQAETLT